MNKNNSTAPPATSAKMERTISVGGSDGGGSGTIILGKYQLGRMLGRGSFAKVYRARALDGGDLDVAIKVIDKAKTVDAAMEPRILREVSAMRRLDHHPNVLKLHEVMATKTKIYFVMELAHGGELFAKLTRHRRFSESMARKYFHQLVSALNFCHQNGVAHRDIKPQNLLLDKQGRLKITDFGLSALQEHKRDGLLYTACGTPAYTAPEVLHRKGYDGAKADAWSCGVILYVFLVGSLPFDDSNLPKMFRAMHRRVFDFPDWVSKPARSVIYRLLDPNPCTRLSIEDLIKLPWFKRSVSQQNLSSNQPEQIATEVVDQQFKYLDKVNAFDIISMSSGLNLSGIFEAGLIRKEMRFTSGAKLGDIEDKVTKTGGELGYRVERGKGGGIGLVKERVVLLMEVWEVAEELWLVELRLKGGDRGTEFGEVKWQEFRNGLSDVVLSWHTDVVC